MPTLPVPRRQEAPMDPGQLASLLETLGCPPDKSRLMADQLDKRARQLAGQQGRPYREALSHLLHLMKQGWAAKERGL